MARWWAIAALVACAAACVWVQVELWDAVRAATYHGFPLEVPGWVPAAGFLASLTAQATLLPGLVSGVRLRQVVGATSIAVVVLSTGVLSAAVISEIMYVPCYMLTREEQLQHLQDVNDPRFEECSFDL